VFRFSKFDINHWFDGKLHLIKRGVDFPEVMADDDVIHRLRNAASYRKHRITLSPTPAGLLVQAGRDQKDGVLTGGLVEDLLQAQQQIEELEEKLAQIELTYEARLKAMEQEHEHMKEELSLLKTRRSLPTTWN
jgi:flagellar motility protein MotE (MotC chaperone)